MGDEEEGEESEKAKEMTRTVGYSGRERHLGRIKTGLVEEEEKSKV